MISTTLFSQLVKASETKSGGLYLHIKKTKEPFDFFLDIFCKAFPINPHIKIESSATFVRSTPDGAKVIKPNLFVFIDSGVLESAGDDELFLPLEQIEPLKLRQLL
ncbi:MAG: hypothetical protein ACRCV9_13120 [Burkholderiaceae bacterium]